MKYNIFFDGGASPFALVYLSVTSITQSAGLLDLVFSRDFKMVLGAWWKDELEREPQLKNVLAKSNAKMEQLLGM